MAETSARTGVFASSQDIVVGLFGLATSGLTAMILWLVDDKLGFSLYSWTWLFVVPVGAIAAGFAGASGYIAGARLTQRRPSPLLLLNILIVSLTTFFLVHYLEYRSLDIQGKHVADYISFPMYLDAVIESSSMSFMVRTTKVGETGRMGWFGYIPAALQVLGFALGGLVVWGYLTSLPYCDRCSRYLTKKGKQERFSTDVESMQSNVSDVRSWLGAGEAGAAAKAHASFGRPDEPIGTPLRSTFAVYYCTKCSRHWVGFAVERKDGESWKEIEEWQAKGFVEGSVSV
jgi:hypothetical protein